jgi:hypothetical protein
MRRTRNRLHRSRCTANRIRFPCSHRLPRRPHPRCAGRCNRRRIRWCRRSRRNCPCYRRKWGNWKCRNSRRTARSRSHCHTHRSRSHRCPRWEHTRRSHSRSHRRGSSHSDRSPNSGTASRTGRRRPHTRSPRSNRDPSSTPYHWCRSRRTNRRNCRSARYSNHRRQSSPGTSRYSKCCRRFDLRKSHPGRRYRYCSYPGYSLRRIDMA